MNPIDFNTTEQREVADGETRPVKLEHSGTKDKYAVSHASDLDIATMSGTVDPSGGDEVWLKLFLEKVYCIQLLKRWNKEGEVRNAWTCTNDNCNNCEGASCSNFTYDVTVEIEDKKSQSVQLSSFPDCKYGDTVKLEIIDTSIFVSEIAVIAKQGNLVYYKTR